MNSQTNANPATTTAPIGIILAAIGAQELHPHQEGKYAASRALLWRQSKLTEISRRIHENSQRWTWITHQIQSTSRAEIWSGWCPDWVETHGEDTNNQSSCCVLISHRHTKTQIWWCLEWSIPDQLDQEVLQRQSWAKLWTSNIRLDQFYPSSLIHKFAQI